MYIWTKSWLIEEIPGHGLRTRTIFMKKINLTIIKTLAELIEENKKE